MPSELTNQDADLLSAYLDNALDADEHAAFEARLSQDEFLRRELEALRHTIELVNALPVLKAPRSFTLTPEMVAPRPEPVPMRMAQPAAPMIAPNEAPASVRVLPKPRPRRMMWQPLAAAAAVVVLAFGFFSVLTLNNGTANMPQVASANTEVPAFSNMVIGTGVESDNAASDAQSEAANTQGLVTAAKGSTEIAPLASDQRVDLTQIPGALVAPQDQTQQQFSQGGMGGGGDFTANANINPDPALPGFTAATAVPMQDGIIIQSTGQNATLAEESATTLLNPATSQANVPAPNATPAPAEAMSMNTAPTALSAPAEEATTTLLNQTSIEGEALPFVMPTVEAEQAEWLRVLIALLNPIIGRFLPMP